MSQILDKISAKLLGLVIDLLQKIKNGVISIDEFVGFLNMNSVKRKEVFGIKTIISFVVGDIFKHRDDTTKVRQYFGGNFKPRLWGLSQNKTITIPSNMEKLKEYVLPQHMKDIIIQKNNSSTPVDEDTFWILLYCLIIEPQLGKELLGYECKKDGTVYFIHVKAPDDTLVTVHLDWHDEWYLDAYSFEYGGNWGRGNVFLYFLHNLRN